MDEKQKHLEARLKKIQKRILTENHGTWKAAEKHIASRNRHIGTAVVMAGRTDLTKYKFKDTDMLVHGHNYSEPDRWSWAFHEAMGKLINEAKQINGEKS